MKGFLRFIPFLFFYAIASTVLLGAQQNLNDFYSYPLSIGVTFQQLTPVGLVERQSNVSDLSLELRYPLPRYRTLFPLLKIGMTTFDSDETADPIILDGSLDPGASLPDFDGKNSWDHYNFWTALGMGYSRRLSREFEIGGEFLLGIHRSYYDRRAVDSGGEWYPFGETGFTAGLNGKITLNPSFNLSVDITPGFLYNRSMGMLYDFDGIYFGLGFAAHFRFGRDPEAAGNEIRALKFDVPEVPPVFAAMQNVYVDRPFTEIIITNSEKVRLEDLSVSFYQSAYMDAPTLCAELDELAPGESVRVPLFAAFNESVFLTQGERPLTGEIRIEYLYKSRPATQNRSLGFTLQDRNSLVWDSDEKVAAFITPRDSGVRNYASFITDRLREHNTDYLPDPLEQAMQIYHALDSMDIDYQSDPASPFAQVQGDRVYIDTVSLPRETLVRGIGDCDDLTVLYNALLESINVSTGFVTVPGHIYAAIDTGLSPREYRKIHPDRDMSLVFSDSLWILIEVTLIGKADFLEAWHTGMQEYNLLEDRPGDRHLYSTRIAQQEYRPVGLQETDLGLQYGDSQVVVEAFVRERDRLGRAILEPIRRQAEARSSSRSWNTFGVTAARLNDYSSAENAFGRAIALDRKNLGAYANLGSLMFLQGDFAGALTAYADALKISDGTDPARESSILVNMAIAQNTLGRSDAAEQTLGRIREIDPERAEKLSYAVLQPSEEEGRASGPADFNIIFIEEEKE
ncbi:MAG: hypothetical protein JXR86_07370 [Spirochaetales bacterium]|nr:hypothetical protein [Spirochaetales bacterium]